MASFITNNPPAFQVDTRNLGNPRIYFAAQRFNIAPGFSVFVESIAKDAGLKPCTTGDREKGRNKND